MGERHFLVGELPASVREIGLLALDGTNWHVLKSVTEGELKRRILKANELLNYETSLEIMWIAAIDTLIHGVERGEEWKKLADRIADAVKSDLRGIPIVPKEW